MTFSTIAVQMIGAIVSGVLISALYLWLFYLMCISEDDL